MAIEKADERRSYYYRIIKKHYLCEKKMFEISGFSHSFGCSSDKLFSNLTTSLDVNGTEVELTEKKIPNPYEKGRTDEPVYEPLKRGRQHYFSTSKQSCLHFEEI